MAVITFRVVGVPVPKARARVVHRNGHTQAFTPPTTAEWEATVTQAYLAAAQGVPPIPAGTPVALSIEIITPGKGPQASIRGDLDNYVKGILDGLNGYAFADDVQVVELRARKRRVNKGEFPGAVVTVGIPEGIEVPPMLA